MGARIAKIFFFLYSSNEYEHFSPNETIKIRISTSVFTDIKAHLAHITGLHCQVQNFLQI